MDENSQDYIDPVVNDCKYMNCCDFQFNNVNKISIMHVNSRSLFKNYDDFVVFLSCVKHKFSVIGISETWFKQTTDTRMFDIPGYSLLQVCRSNKRGGGVLLYIRDGIDYKLRNDLSGEHAGFESIFVEIVTDDSKSIVGCVYRAPDNDIPSFIQSFDHHMQIIGQERKDIYLMGDFNVNLLNYDSDGKVKDFIDFLTSFGLFALITKPTRITSSTSTLIDNIFTNCIQDTFECGIFCTDFSDHMPIFSINKGKSLTNEKINDAVYRRVITNERVQNFQQDLLVIDWSFLYSLTAADDSYNYFLSVFSNLYEIHFPLVQLSRKKKCKRP